LEWQLIGSKRWRLKQRSLLGRSKQWQASGNEENYRTEVIHHL
ncbi:MAG: hypothetical protein RLZZ252_587, partial [Bacteroidota bacterium]